MDKNKILMQAQQEGKAGTDEGTRHSMDLGRSYGKVGVCLIFAVLSISSIVTGSSIAPEAYAMFTVCLGGEMFALWQSNRKWGYLIPALLLLAVTLLHVVLAVRKMAGNG